MNYLSGAFRYVAGGDTVPGISIPRLVDRLTSASLPQDRRSALSALGEASKSSPARQTQVGELAVKPLYAVLEQDAEYDDTVKAALDLLLALCATLDPPQTTEAIQAMMGEEAQGRILPEQQMMQAFEHATARAAETNIDMFLGLPGAVSLLLVLLEKSDFYLRFSTIELFTAMAANSRRTLQGALLEAPQGVSRICDLLDATHRLLRSNAVLLLSTLCDDSTEIAKIVAYAGVLEKLFTLIEGTSGDRVESFGGEEEEDEDDSLEAAIVVQDVLYVLRNLIRGANTTRTFFRDTGCLPRLVNLIKRTSTDANMPAVQHLPASSSGRKSALEKQARKNLVIAMQCIAGLAKDADSETRLVKNDLAATNVFNILASLAFAPIAKAQAEKKKENLPEHVLQVRVGALKTIALLARGHDDFRAMFGSATFSMAGEADATCAQIAALRAMLGDSSSAVRVAAYSALRESFVVDAGLDLPSSNLLNTMTSVGGSAAHSVGDGATGHRRNPMSSNDLASPSNPVPFIAESLKAALVGWPSVTDAAGVFYAASLLTWVLDRVDGARERLLAAYVNGGSLLPQVIRVLGKLEREKGPPEVRIALFSLACTWLHGSSSAVSAFLSSAMHLPMLVDVLNGTGARGDVAEVHVRGLSAVLLGICLQATDGAQDTANDGGFLSGGGGLSMVIPRGTVADVIRNRIGVTVFTACLDDLRASKAFASEDARGNLWAFADRLTTAEERTGFLSGTGNLGHDRWYGAEVVTAVNDVYKNVGAKALDLISEQSLVPSGAGNSVASNVMTNGRVGDPHPGGEVQKALLADSARDEVLNSYKEFIRSQDESLNAARRQIEELATALRETQRELDGKTNEALVGKESGMTRGVEEANEELLAQKEALETLLDEKTKDFAALSDAYASLEEEQNNHGSSAFADTSSSVAAEVSSLRSQNADVRGSLNAAIAKNMELNHQATLLDSTVKAQASELAAVARERDMLKSNARPEVAEALQWRTRAEVSEANLIACQSMLDSVQHTKTSLEGQLVEAHRSRDDGSLSVSSFQKELESARVELEDLRSTRRRELQVARESSQAATAAAQAEIAILRDQLIEARQARSEAPSEDKIRAQGEEMQNFERLKHDHQSLIASFEQAKTELLDTKSAISQWQKRAEAAETAKERDMLEKDRLTNFARDLQSQVLKMKDDFASQSQISSARVVELEQQNAELDEMRRRAGEEAKLLKEELAARTEQSIRLSGQLYETDESKVKIEEQLQELQNRLSDTEEKLILAGRHSSSGTGVGSEGKEIGDDLQTRIAALQEELEVTKDALTDSEDRQSLGEAHAREREAAISKAASLEERLVQAQVIEAQLTNEVDELKQRLLSLDEAEEAKRALTMQVVSLQNSLAEVSPGTPSTANTKLLDSEGKVRQLQTQIQEKDMRLQGLESSLTAALDRADATAKDKLDMEKQVTETEVMLSVLNSERDSLSAKCEQLKSEVDSKPPLSGLDSSLVPELEEKLQESESKRTAVSNELASLVDACRQSEQATRKLRDDSEILREELTRRECELQKLQKDWEDSSLKNEVENVVNSTILETAVETAVQAFSDANAVVLDDVRRERDIAVSHQDKQSRELEDLGTALDALQVTIRDRDVSLAAATARGDQLTQLTAKLADLESVAEEREGLMRSLEDSRASILELEKQKDALCRHLEEESRSRLTAENARSLGIASDVSSEAPSSPTHRRVAELEDALRDAARTVSATNLELISAQALLVELSADKTAIRTDLAGAQEQIQQLSARISIEARSHPNESALSEVSEQEQPVAEEPGDSSNASAEQELTEQCLKTAQGEVGNLRKIVQQSISEADSAVSLLSTIDVKIQQVEQKLKSSQSSLDDAKAGEKVLGTELVALKQSYEAEKLSLVTEIGQLKKEMSSLRRETEEESKKLTDKVKSLEFSASAEREKARSALLKKEDLLESLGEESAGLRSQLEDTKEKVERFSDKAKVLEDANANYASNILALEGTVSSVKKALVESENRENSLQESLREAVVQLQRKQEAVDSERKALQIKQEKEVEELESELDRSSKALEDAERKFRNAEVSLKTRVATLETTVELKKSEIESLEQKFQSTSEVLAITTKEVKKLESELSERMREHEVVVAGMTKERDDTLLLVQERTSERDSKEQKLADTRASLEKIESELEEEREQKAMLEVEHQDFMASIESLETSSKRLRDKLSKTEDDLKTMTRQFEETAAVVEQQGDELKNTTKQCKHAEDKCQELQTARVTLQVEVQELRVSVEISEKAREAAEQDNFDLKAWVADLERQATDLQTAAENFEEVEQSLREALDVQRDVAEQNADLAEALKKERELVASTEAQLRSVVREKYAAESARESSQRRTTDLEARIREIREEHLVKFSNSEDAIKTKAQRCAELETMLASAERQLAELALVSDSLFGAQADLNQREEDIKNLGERAQAAEVRAEDLQTKVQRMDSEMVEMRESSTGDAYRTLEAEHNELLVCLADLEMECTALKEELGRE